MKVCVAGLWHLGSVTAACLAAAGHDVVGHDPDAQVVASCAAGKPPVHEPGLEDLFRTELPSGRLSFTSSARDAVSGADVVWITYDTPVDDDDRADVGHVMERTTSLFPFLKDGALVLISSQLPVGSTASLERAFAAAAHGRTAGFAYSPENLRLGSAIAAFTKPDRVIAGVRSERDKQTVAALFAPITDRIEWMSVESAELTKHAVNAFLATSVTFINEIAAIAEEVGADAREVERGLKTEGRIGPKAYLSPGGAFAGGTLARDVVFLTELASRHRIPAALLPSVKTSNDAHRSWAARRLERLLGRASDLTVAVWGLTYKPGTDTLRRSSSIEMCRHLAEAGATVRAHDPKVGALPGDLKRIIDLVDSAPAALDGASALVVATPWPEYREVRADDLVARMARPLVLDPNRFTAENLGRDTRIEFMSVGQSSTS